MNFRKRAKLATGTLDAPRALWYALVIGGRNARTQPTEREMGNAKTQAETIVDQLGGARFCAMVGVRQLSCDFTANRSAALTVKFAARANRGINCVRVTLDPSDTYTVEFLKVGRFDWATIAEYSAVYAPDLAPLFRTVTGLATTL